MQEGENRKQKLVTGVITGASVAAFLIFFVWLMLNITHDNRTVDLVYSKIDGKPRILAVFADVGSGEDGEYLRGYNVQLIDPLKGEKLDEITIARSLDKVPPDPVVKVFGSQCWIIQKPEMIQGDTGFITRVVVKSGKLAEEKIKAIKGFIPGEFGSTYLLGMVNKYNEKFCFNLISGRIYEGICGMVSGFEDRKSTFFFVNKTETSARYHLYYYEADKPDPMEIRAGSGNDEKSVLYYLWFSRNKMPQSDLENYQQKIQSPELIRPIYTKDYLITPQELATDSARIVFVEYKGDIEQTNYYCFTKEGKQCWKYTEENTSRQPYQRSLKAVFAGNLSLLVLDGKKIIAFNCSNGKTEWEYTP